VRRLAGLGLFLTALSSAALARPDEGACRDAFDAEAARQVFDRLQAHVGADGCTLSDLRTDRARMTVRWTKHGEPVPEATIDPVACAPAATVAGDTLALTSPPELAAACPDALAAMTDAVRALHPPTASLASNARARSRPFAVASWIGIALALFGAMVAVGAALRRGVPGE
jgi:hypothetical protein